jgi:hypothetical protein
MWMSEWRAISARIAALLGAGTFFFRTNDNDNYGGADVLIRNAEATVLSLRRFLELQGDHIPIDSKTCLDMFLEDYSERFGGTDENHPFSKPIGFSGATGVFTSLASFRAEFEYLVADTEAVARSLVTRALIHLQRSIVADDTIRQRWLGAFNDRETACEALGACHLLAHGIWAFKTSAAGERTDLVLGQSLPITDDVRSASQGLVLTEWKLVRGRADLRPKAREALDQAKRYREGILAGFEVASPRYLVIVSEDYLVMPPVEEEAGVKYEYRNIAVAPTTPSQHATADSKGPKIT